MGHLNSFLELGDGNLTAKNSNARGVARREGGMLRLQIDRCIRRFCSQGKTTVAWLFFSTVMGC